jgi:hypothetical protein
MRIEARDQRPLVGELDGRGAERPRAKAAPREADGDDGDDVRLPGATDAEQATRDEPGGGKPALPEFPLQELSIRLEDEIGKVVVQVIDSRTREVVRQIPPEEWVRVLHRLKNARGAKGILVNEAG